MAAPDVLFSWEYPIFFIGNEFHLLPFILGGVMFLQQRLMSPMPSDPSQMTDQQRQSADDGDDDDGGLYLDLLQLPVGA